MVFSQEFLFLSGTSAQQSRNDAATAAVLSFFLFFFTSSQHWTADVRYTPATITIFYLPTKVPTFSSLQPVNN
jgi:hypothetical protein